MATPLPTDRWYQFRLRTLLVLATFIAMLCSLGVYTHWLVPTFIGVIVALGGIAGRVVAGTRAGFVQGVVLAVQFSSIGFLLAGMCLRDGLGPSWAVLFQLLAVVGVTSLIGGILGGLTVRPRRRQ